MSTAAQAEQGYVFDNDSVHASEQHRCLAAMLDRLTCDRLERTGVSSGWRCLEVGAGGGSVATWLAQRVAPTGHVLATDIKPSHIPATPGLEVVRHDITNDPLPQDHFDLIHARLVLFHLSQRTAVVTRLVRALRPGGWLQLDEFDITYAPPILSPDAASAALYERFMAAKAAQFAATGADLAWGRNVASVMAAAGLGEIDVAISVQQLDADAPGMHLLVHHTHHLQQRLLSHGLTYDELIATRRLLAAPGFVAASCPIYSVQGRRPVTSDAYGSPQRLKVNRHD